jgi:hypothetical protein
VYAASFVVAVLLRYEMMGRRGVRRRRRRREGEREVEVEAGRWKEEVKGEEGGRGGSIGTGTPSAIPYSFLSCLLFHVKGRRKWNGAGDVKRERGREGEIFLSFEMT